MVPHQGRFVAESTVEPKGSNISKVPEEVLGQTMIANLYNPRTSQWPNAGPFYRLHAPKPTTNYMLGAIKSAETQNTQKSCPALASAGHFRH